MYYTFSEIKIRTGTQAVNIIAVALTNHQVKTRIAVTKTSIAVRRTRIAATRTSIAVIKTNTETKTGREVIKTKTDIRVAMNINHHHQGTRIRRNQRIKNTNLGTEKRIRTGTGVIGIKIKVGVIRTNTHPVLKTNIAG